MLNFTPFLAIFRHNLTEEFFDSPWAGLILGVDFSRSNLRDTKFRPLLIAVIKKIKFRKFWLCHGTSKNHQKQVLCNIPTLSSNITQTEPSDFFTIDICYSPIERLLINEIKKIGL